MAGKQRIGVHSMLQWFRQCVSENPALIPTEYLISFCLCLIFHRLRTVWKSSFLKFASV